MRKLLITLIFFTHIFCTGCSRPIENPETFDPIHQRLLNESKSYQDSIKQIEKDIVEIKKDLKSTIPQSGMRQQFEGQLAKKQNELTHLKQMETFYLLRARSRKSQIRQKYLKAFKEGQKWPTQEIKDEYKEFTRIEKLRNINLNWEARVPKLNIDNQNLTTPSKDTQDQQAPH